MLCLIWLHLGLSVLDLTTRFQTSISTVSRPFLDMIGVLFVCPKPIIRWPEKEDLSISMTLCFMDKFEKKIKVIMSYLEQAKYLTARILTSSTYKSRHTAKYLIGITPQSTIPFISKGWGVAPVTSI